jgi:tetratricopeptide (TPR) repeat protein
MKMILKSRKYSFNGDGLPAMNCPQRQLVQETRALAGDEPFRSTALAASKGSYCRRSAHMALGQALGGKRDYEGPVAEMRSAVALSPEDPRPHRLLAGMLAMMGSPAAAAAEYQQAVRLDPTDAGAHFTLGAQLEAAAGDAVKPKAGRMSPVSGKLSKAAADNYQAAYEQYKLAPKLVPELAAYTEAYERLGKQIGAKP